MTPILCDSRTSMRPRQAGTLAPISTGANRQRDAIILTLTSYFARKLVSCPTTERARYRNQLVGLLKRAQQPWICIDQLLHICTREGGPDGLDAAIDVLARMGTLIVEYAWLFLGTDVRDWTPDSERAYQPNDDYWYVLLRAVGRADVAREERFRFIACCASAESRGIREGVVEGLRDLGGPVARERLVRMAREDTDTFIRSLAREALEEWES